MSNRINVTGIDPWELLAALHNNAKVPPTAVCMAQAKGDVTAEEVRREAIGQLVNVGPMPFWPDYVFGRPIKAFLVASGNEVFLSRTDLYDRSAGEGTAARIVCAIRWEQREAELVSALNECVEELSDVSVFGRGIIEKGMHESIDETISRVQSVLEVKNERGK